VNPGSDDPLPEIMEIVRKTDAWLHVDGAFGLWVAASPRRRHLGEGVGGADSSTRRRPQVAARALRLRARLRASRRPPGIDDEEDLLPRGAGRWMRDAAGWTPESSRRARAFTVYAALRSLGRRGVADLVDRCCDHVRRFAARVSAHPGCGTLNEVVTNQVLFRFSDDETTNAVPAHVQKSGEAWMGGTAWDGRAAIRLSVSG